MFTWHRSTRSRSAGARTVTGEKALPVLQAAHIRPVTKEGPHRVDNGLLLRSDSHALF
ncbi:MAG: HNH endonuclease, partial [candidate division NC10 bacterium]|nr:HNH endonuclease [candidate division NC10 bacterium]